MRQGMFYSLVISITISSVLTIQKITVFVSRYLFDLHSGLFIIKSINNNNPNGLYHLVHTIDAFDQIISISINQDDRNIFIVVHVYLVLSAFSQTGFDFPVNTFMTPFH